MPLFSVIIPVFNGQDRITATLRSVLAQSFANYEVIVVDDGSTDRTVELVEEFAPRLSGRLSLIHQPNRGPLAARQSGWRYARGSYILNLDADDCFHPNLMERLAKLLEVNPVDLVLFDTTTSLPWVESAEPSHSDLPARTVLDAFEIRAMYCRGTGRRVWEYCIARNILTEDALVTEEVGDPRYFEDQLQCCLFCSQAKSLIYLPERLHYYHDSPNSLSKGLDERTYLDYAKVIRTCESIVQGWEEEAFRDGHARDTLLSTFRASSLMSHAFHAFPRIADANLVRTIAREGLLSACLGDTAACRQVRTPVLAKAKALDRSSSSPAVHAASLATRAAIQAIKNVNDALPKPCEIKERAVTLACRNRFILGKRNRPCSPQRVNVEEWRTPEGKPNLGDALSPVVVDWMLARRGLPAAAQLPVEKTRFLAAVGSVLGMGVNDTCVWGAGLLRPESSWNLRPRIKRMDVRAVRGPRTRSELERLGYTVPEVYGDPAILLPLIYSPDRPASQPDQAAAPLVIRHHLSQQKNDVTNILTSDYRSFVDVIVKSSIVVTSSLHAIILAEVYGVPAVLYYDDRRDWDLFKYADWYESTGRPRFPVAVSPEDALNLQPAPLPDPALLNDLRAALIRAFPYDLWE